MSQDGQTGCRVAIYARCSTTEKQQDVNVQLTELRRHCQVMGWSFTEFAEYDSGYRGEQPKLHELLSRIRRHEFDCLLVYSLDRLSRRPPSYTNRLLDELVEQQGVRFISKLEGIDSANELSWNMVRPILAYFANLFSRNLSEKIKLGIKTKREKGVYRGGRPRKAVDPDRLKALLLTRNGDGWRKLAQRYNEGLRSDQQVSFSLLRKVIQQLQFASQQPTNGAVSITPAPR